MKNNKTLLWVGGAVLVVGAVGFIFWNKFRRKAEEKLAKQQDQTPEKEITPTLPPIPPLPNLGGLFGIGQTVGQALGEWKDYQTVTQSTKLNIRKGAGTNTAIVGSLNKGQIVKARGFDPNSTDKKVPMADGLNWFQVSLDGGKTVKGYVASKYLKLVK